VLNENSVNKQIQEVLQGDEQKNQLDYYNQYSSDYDVKDDGHGKDGISQGEGDKPLKDKLQTYNFHTNMNEGKF